MYSQALDERDEHEVDDLVLTDHARRDRLVQLCARVRGATEEIGVAGCGGVLLRMLRARGAR